MVDIIERNELEQLIAQGDVVLVDALPPGYYNQQHLPGAINIVEADVDALASDLIPDRAIPIVTYCTGPSCGNSQAVALRLQRLGYVNVRKYRDGIEGWVQAGNKTESVSVV